MTESEASLLALGPNELLELISRVMPPVTRLGLTIEHLDEQTLSLRLPYRDRYLRPGGTISGPTMMMLADTAAWIMTLARVGAEPLTVTSNLNIDFLRKPEPADLIADTELLKIGRRLSVCAVHLRSDGKPMSEPVAHATVTYAIPSRSSRK